MLPTAIWVLYIRKQPKDIQTPNPPGRGWRNGWGPRLFKPTESIPNRPNWPNWPSPICGYLRSTCRAQALSRRGADGLPVLILQKAVEDKPRRPQNWQIGWGIIGCQRGVPHRMCLAKCVAWFWGPRLAYPGSFRCPHGREIETT